MRMAVRQSKPGAGRYLRVHQHLRHLPIVHDPLLHPAQHLFHGAGHQGGIGGDRLPLVRVIAERAQPVADRRPRRRT